MEGVELPPPTPPAKGGLPAWGWVVIAFVAVGCLGVGGVGLLAMIAVPTIESSVDAARTAKVVADLSELQDALHAFAIEHGGAYPESLEELYAEGVAARVDPWSNAYVYEPPGPSRPEPRLFSLGADGQVGGEGAAADLDLRSVLDGR